MVNTCCMGPVQFGPFGADLARRLAPDSGGDVLELSCGTPEAGTVSPTLRGDPVLKCVFIRLPLAALVGYVFYAEPLDPLVFFGAAIIFAGTYYSISREGR